MLEMRPSCEHCGAELPADALDARICTFECTFCAACTDDLLGGVCPNCAGELVPRPVRTAAMLDRAPPSDARVHSPVDLDRHAATIRGRPGGPDHGGVALRRYVDCWRRGDLVGLIGCYAEDFTLHYGGASRFAGTHRGRDAALAVMADVSTVAPRELCAVDEVLVTDGGGALLVTERLSRNNTTVEIQRLLRYRVENGLLAECWLYETDQSIVDDLWR